MVTVKIRDGEEFESLLKRFKKAVERSGILADFRKSECYEKPSVKLKKKQIAARKREAKRRAKLLRQRSRAGKNINFRWNKDRTKKIPMGSKPKFNNKRVVSNRSHEGKK